MGIKYFRVKNFEKFQNYKDGRDQPWIKLHLHYLSSYEFSKIPDSSKAHLFLIFLLAQTVSNKIPFDPSWVAGRIQADTRVDLNLFLSLGFIEEIIEEQREENVEVSLESEVSQPSYEHRTSTVQAPYEKFEEREKEEKAPLVPPLSPHTPLLPPIIPQKEEKENGTAQIFRLEKQKAKKATGLSREKFEITAEMRAWAEENNFQNLESETEKFFDFHEAKGSIFKSWAAAWRTWMRNSVNFKPRSPPGNSAAISLDQQVESFKKYRQERGHAD